MPRQIICLVKRGGVTREVILPADAAAKLSIDIGKKLKIKETDHSALWEVVELKDDDPDFRHP